MRHHPATAAILGFAATLVIGALIAAPFVLGDHSVATADAGATPCVRSTVPDAAVEIDDGSPLTVEAVEVAGPGLLSLRGTAAPGAIVVVGNSLAEADTTGFWSLLVDEPLENALVVVSEDPAGSTVQVEVGVPASVVESLLVASASGDDLVASPAAANPSLAAPEHMQGPADMTPGDPADGPPLNDPFAPLDDPDEPATTTTTIAEPPEDPFDTPGPIDPPADDPKPPPTVTATTTTTTVASKPPKDPVPKPPIEPIAITAHQHNEASDSPKPYAKFYGTAPQAPTSPPAANTVQPKPPPTTTVNGSSRSGSGTTYPPTHPSPSPSS